MEAEVVGLVDAVLGLVRLPHLVVDPVGIIVNDRHRAVEQIDK